LLLNGGTSFPNSSSNSKVSEKDIQLALEKLNKTLKRSSTIHETFLRERIEDFKYKGPFLVEANFVFDLIIPNSEGHQGLNQQYIRETASRLLVLTAKWAQSIEPFQALWAEGCTSLLRDSWHELFLIGLFQSSHVINLDRFLECAVHHFTSTLPQGT